MVKKKSKGKGWRKEPVRHSMASRGIPTTNINKHNWSFESDGDSWKGSLGNFTDAGWYWSAEEDQFLGYIIRILNSDINDEFISEMEERDITFNDLKDEMIDALVEYSDGLYQLSGDNRVWHFGQDDVDTYYLKDDLKQVPVEELKQLAEQSDEDYDELVDEFLNYEYYWDYGADFDSFAEEYGSWYKDEMKRIIEDSNNFEEFGDKVDRLRRDLAEERYRWTEMKAMEDVRESAKDWAEDELSKY